MIFIVRKTAELDDEIDRFGAILESECGEDAVKYKAGHDQLFGQDWNKGGSTFATEALKHPECALAFTLESAYFGTADNIVTSEKLLKLGQAFARAVKEYVKG